VIDDVVAANQGVETADLAALSPNPTRHLAVVTCMDTRIDPLGGFGLSLGQAHVVRNAGGRVTDDVIRSLAASHHFLGTTAVMVVHHSSCGMLAPDPDEPRRQIEGATGVDLGDFDLLTFADEEAAVRDDVERVRASSLLPDLDEVRGFVYDLDTGRLGEVAVTASTGS
jgi:carbonic anhydrase